MYILFQADILQGLPQLKHLDRGDFLADCCEYWHENSENMEKIITSTTSTMDEKINPPTLKIQEFWASEEYFFHTEEQMDLVSKYCPDIKKMLFYFQNTYWYVSIYN